MWAGMLGGGAVGVYLGISSYFLFGRLFLSDLLFQVNLIVTSFVLAAVGKLAPGSETGHELYLLGGGLLVQVLLYAGLGTVVGLFFDWRGTWTRG